MKKLVSSVAVAVESKIYRIRDCNVMLDAELAALYGTTTKALNQAVKRNLSRFPSDFMFQLTAEERAEVVTNCDHLRMLRFSHSLPLAFTEQGLSMLSSVLNSEQAIQVNIAIMRVFVRAKDLFARKKDLTAKLRELEERVDTHDANIKAIFSAVKHLVDPKQHHPRIGFKAKP